MSSVRVVVIGAVPMLRQGIRQTLDGEEDIEVVGEAGDAGESVTMVVRLMPDIVVVDTSVRELRAPLVVRQVRKAGPKIAVGAIVETDRDPQILPLVEAGAQAILLRTADSRELIEAIRTIRSGKLVLESAIGHRLLEARQARSRHLTKSRHALTARESEILKMVARGLRSEEIGMDLGISQRTVKAHLANTLEKLGARSRTEAVLTGLKSGILSLEDTCGHDDACCTALGDEQPYSTHAKASLGACLGMRSTEAQVCSIGSRLTGTRSRPTQGYSLANVSLDLSQALLEQTHEGCYMIQDEKYVFVNGRMADMLGYSQSELIGRPFMEVMPHQLREQAVRAYWSRVSGEPLPERFVFGLLGRDGRVIPLGFSLRVTVYKGRPATIAVVSRVDAPVVEEEEFRRLIEARFSG